MNQYNTNYTSIALILLLSIAVIYRSWKNKRTANSFCISLMECTDSLDKHAIVGGCVRLCDIAIAAGIDSMISESAIEACRNNRIFHTLYAGYKAYAGNQSNLRNNNYLNEAWKSGLRITELTRNITTSPEYSLPADEKNNIMTIKEEILKLSGQIQDFSSHYGEWRLKTGKVKDLVSSNIRRYSDLMNHEDNINGNFKYTYLLLLHNLHTYLVSVQNVFK